MKILKYSIDILLMGLLLFSALSGISLKKQKKKLLEKHTNMVLYAVSSIGSSLLIVLYYFLEQYAPEYMDSLFYWLWIPAVCFCFLLLLESRFHIWNEIRYALSFWKKGIRTATLAVVTCLGMLVVLWYGFRLNQMFFRSEQYQLAEEHEWQQLNWQQNGTPNLDLAWMVEGSYVTKYNTRDEQITPFSRKKLYIEFTSSEQWMGDDLHLELFHYGKWYRLKDVESAEQKLSGRQWISQSEGEYYEVDLNVLQGVIPGFYRLCMSVWKEDTKEDKNYVSTYFGIK